MRITRNIGPAIRGTRGATHSDGPAGQKGGAAPGREGRNLDHFCLQVEPFDGEAIIAHLKEHGCEPGPIESRYGANGQGPSIYVPDPEGNMVELKGPPWEAGT